MMSIKRDWTRLKSASGPIFVGQIDIPARAPAAPDRARRGGRGPADRRDRPLGLRVRGVPARVPLRLPDHDPGGRHAARRRGRRSSCSRRTARASCTTRSSAAASTTGSRSPTPTRERAILRAQAPGLDDAAADALVEAIKRVRGEQLLKRPGIAETIDWAQGAQALARGGRRLAGGAAPLARAAAQGAGGRRARRRARPGPSRCPSRGCSRASTCTGSCARSRTPASRSRRRRRRTSSSRSSPRRRRTSSRSTGARG